MALTRGSVWACTPLSCSSFCIGESDESALIASTFGASARERGRAAPSVGVRVGAARRAVNHLDALCRLGE